MEVPVSSEAGSHETVEDGVALAGERPLVVEAVEVAAESDLFPCPVLMRTLLGRAYLSMKIFLLEPE